MKDKTPPLWAKRLAQDLDKGYSREIGLTTKECALLVAMHAPDAEALALALEDLESNFLKRDANPEIEKLRQALLDHAPEKTYSFHRALTALAAHRTRFPKE